MWTLYSTAYGKFHVCRVLVIACLWPQKSLARTNSPYMDQREPLFLLLRRNTGGQGRLYLVYNLPRVRLYAGVCS